MLAHLKKAFPRETTIGQNILANGGPSVQLANTANEKTENSTKNTDIASSKNAVQIVLPDDSAVHFVQPADADGEKMSTIGVSIHIEFELPKVLIKVLFCALFWGKELFWVLFWVLLIVPELF